jgi:hypothetical protein
MRSGSSAVVDDMEQKAPMTAGGLDRHSDRPIVVNDQDARHVRFRQRRDAKTIDSTTLVRFRHRYKPALPQACIPGAPWQ